jgi:hypothetical protein
MRNSTFFWLGAIVSAALVWSPVHAQTKTGTVIKGKAKVNAFTFKMEKGNAYRIRVEAEGFTPVVDVMDDLGSIANNFGNGKTAEVIFSPTKTFDYHIMVAPTVFAEVEDGKNKFTVIVEKAQFTVEKKEEKPLGQSIYRYKMEKGKIYFVTVKSTALKPEVRLITADGQTEVKEADKQGQEYVATLVSMPARTQEVKILVNHSPFNEIGKGPFDYTIDIATREPLLTVNGKLTAKDTAYELRNNSYHKVHEIKLEAGKNYQINLVADFDTYLFLEDAGKKVVSADDDGGSGLNARISYSPRETGTFRIIATTFGPRVKGDYTLSVVELPGADKN